MATRRRTFGKLLRLPSGRYRASYVGPDGERHAAPVTFVAKADGNAWLSLREAEIIEGRWKPTATTAPVPETALTFGTYSELWLDNRSASLRPRTRTHYRSLLDNQILPTFADRPVTAVSPAEVSAWHAGVAKGRATLRAHAYGLLRTIFSTAMTEDIVPANPCRIRGASTTKRKKTINPATIDELATIVESIAPKYRLMVLLAAWAQMRFGELTELRRSDVDVKAQVIRIRRGVTHPDGVCEIGPPKSEAGIRDLDIPPHVMPAVTAHLLEHAAPGRRGLLFPPTEGGCHLLPASLYRVYYPARKAAEREDLRFHDLRHTGATLLARDGATLADLMAILGHSTPAAAMIYQHTANDRRRMLAHKLSETATGGAKTGEVVDITTVEKSRKSRAKRSATA